MLYIISVKSSTFTSNFPGNRFQKTLKERTVQKNNGLRNEPSGMLSVHSEELSTPHEVDVVVRLRDSKPGFFRSCLCVSLML